VKFLSIEPLLEALPDLDLRGIDWAIVGGESGPGSRPMNAEWVSDIRDQCAVADVAFFFKQVGLMRLSGSPPVEQEKHERHRQLLSCQRKRLTVLASRSRNFPRSASSRKMGCPSFPRCITCQTAPACSILSGLAIAPPRFPRNAQISEESVRRSRKPALMVSKPRR